MIAGWTSSYASRSPAEAWKQLLDTNSTWSKDIQNTARELNDTRASLLNSKKEAIDAAPPRLQTAQEELQALHQCMEDKDIKQYSKLEKQLKHCNSLLDKLLASKQSKLSTRTKEAYTVL